MVTRLLERQSRENERLLKGLERRYDKQGEHWRRFADDKAAIRTLLERKAIDKDHADILFRAACDAYWQAEWDKRRERDEARGVIRAQNQGPVIALIMLAIAVAWWFLFGHWARSIGW